MCRTSVVRVVGVSVVWYTAADDGGGGVGVVGGGVGGSDARTQGR